MAGLTRLAMGRLQTFVTVAQVVVWFLRRAVASLVFVNAEIVLTILPIGTLCGFGALDADPIDYFERRV